MSDGPSLEVDFRIEAAKRQRERYAPGTRVMFDFPDGSSAPGTITHYYSIGAGLVHIAFDRGDTWLGAASRLHVLREYPWCDIYPELAKGPAS